MFNRNQSYLVGLFSIALCLGSTQAMAVTNPWSPDQTTVPVEVEVLPMASIDFPDGTGGLHLYVPPATSTLPSSGVRFVVQGNATAWVTAAPDQFLFVNPYVVGNTTFPGRYLGRAVIGSGAEIGYNLQVEFPLLEYRALPGTNGGGTSANPVNMPSYGGEVTGYLHLIASHRWTPNGSMPPVGDYTGNIVVTLGAGP